MMARKIEVDGQTLSFERQPGDPPSAAGDIEYGIQVAQVQPWSHVDERGHVLWVREDIDRNRLVALRLAIAWNATRHLSIEELNRMDGRGLPMVLLDAEADSIETDVTISTLPRSRVHQLLHRLQVVLG